MTTTELKNRLLERLKDHEISIEAKKVIVEELKVLGVRTVKCIYQSDRESIGFVNCFTRDNTYIVERETSKSIWVFDDQGISRRFTKNSEGEALETGYTNDYHRSVVIL